MAKSSGGRSPRNENPPPKTTRPVREIASEGLQNPKALTAKEIQTLAASTMRHIEPRKPGSK
jgi:hypothetical protein